MVIVLVGLAIIVGGLLAWVNRITAAPIAKKAEQTLADGICQVMGTTDLTVTANDTVQEMIDDKPFSFVIHKTADKSGQFLGAAVESSTMGFGGDLKVLVGFKATSSDTPFCRVRRLRDLVRKPTNGFRKTVRETSSA